MLSTQAVIVNFPHNPSGCTITAQQQQHIVEICCRTDTWIFSDEMYRLLEHDPAQRLPAFAGMMLRACVHSMSGLLYMMCIFLKWGVTHMKQLSLYTRSL